MNIVTDIFLPDLPGEEWRPVKDFELYEVSNYGRVKRPLQERCYRDGGYPVLFAEKLLSPGYTKGGYAYVMFSIFGRTKTFLVHRLVADAFELPYESPDQTEVHHIDGNPRNNRLENLKRCTPYENKQFNNRGKKVSEGRKAYLAGLSEEERKAMSERAYKKCMRKISCGGKIYDCLKDFAEAIGVKGYVDLSIFERNTISNRDYPQRMKEEIANHSFIEKQNGGK